MSAPSTSTPSPAVQIDRASAIALLDALPRCAGAAMASCPRAATHVRATTGRPSRRWCDAHAPRQASAAIEMRAAPTIRALEALAKGSR